MACPHLPPVWVELASVLEQAKKCRQLTCKAKTDLWVCVSPSCRFVACGRRVAGHAEAHGTQKGHPVCMGVESGVLWCYECEAEVVEMDVAPRDYNSKVRAFHNLVHDNDDGEGGGSSSSSSASGAGGVAASGGGGSGGSGAGAAAVPSGPVPTPSALLSRSDTDWSPFVHPQYPPLTPAEGGGGGSAGSTKGAVTGAGLVGLVNQGNTCFLNSALQALSNVPPLATYFTEVPFTSTRAEKESGLPIPMRHLLLALWDNVARQSPSTGHNTSVYRPSSILSGMRRINPLFEGYSQQDAHEALRTLLTDVHEKLAVDVPVGLYNNDFPAPAYKGIGVSANGVEIGPDSMASGSSAGASAAAGSSSASSSASSSTSTTISAPEKGKGSLARSTSGRVVSSAPGSPMFASGGSSGDGSAGSDASKRLRKGDGLNLRELRERERAAAGGSNSINSSSSSRKAADSDDSEGETESSVRRAGSARSARAASASARSAAEGGESDGEEKENEGGNGSGGKGGSRGKRSDSKGSATNSSTLPSRGSRTWLQDGPYTGPDTVQRSIISDLFQGVFCSRVRCGICKTESLTYETFYDISLPIPDRQHSIAAGGDGSTVPPDARPWAAETEADFDDSSPTASGSSSSSFPIGTGFSSTSAAAGGGADALPGDDIGGVSTPRGGKSGASSSPSGGASRSSRAGSGSSVSGGGEPVVVNNAMRRALAPEGSSSGSSSSGSSSASSSSGAASSSASATPASGSSGSSSVSSSSSASSSASSADGVAASTPSASDSGAGVGSGPSKAPKESNWGFVGRAISSVFCSLRDFLPAGDGFGTSGHGHGGGRDGPIGMGDCLYTFFQWEPLTKPNQYFCEKCKMKVDAERRISIAALPEVLCIQLKRFSYSSWGSKNNTPVAYPLSGLDLSPFLTHGAHGQAVRSYQRAKEQQEGKKLVVVPAESGPTAAEMSESKEGGGGGGGATKEGSRSSSPHRPSGNEPPAVEKGAEVRAGGGSGGAKTVAAAAAAAASSGGAPSSASGSSSSGARAIAIGGGRSSGGGRPASHSIVPATLPTVSAAAAAGGGGNGVVSRKRVVSEMMPEARAIILHRHSLATGTTGVEEVAAALAGGGGTADVLSSAIAIGASIPLPAMLTSGAASRSPAAAMSALAASAAAQRYSLAFWCAYMLPRPAPWLGPLGGPYPVPQARRVLPATLGDTQYDLVSVVQHMGGIGGGHYIAHGKNRFDNNRWFTFDDTHVAPIDAASVPKKEAYILFYQRQRPTSGPLAPCPLPPREPADASYAPVFVSRYWWLRYKTLACPGPISNADILCDHGAVKNDLCDKITQLTVAITPRQYEALALAYGSSEPPLREVAPCAECREEAKALSARRRREQDKIQRVDTTSLPSGEGVWYLMSEVWLARWRNFIRNEAHTDGTGRGVLPPGPIDNARLLGKNGTPLPNQQPSIHYRGVNVNVWSFLSKIYGGGPVLMRSTIDIYGSEPQSAPAAATRASVPPTAGGS